MLAITSAVLKVYTKPVGFVASTDADNDCFFRVDSVDSEGVIRGSVEELLALAPVVAKHFKYDVEIVAPCRCCGLYFAILEVPYFSPNGMAIGGPVGARDAPYIIPWTGLCNAGLLAYCDTKFVRWYRRAANLLPGAGWPLKGETEQVAVDRWLELGAPSR